MILGGPGRDPTSTGRVPECVQKNPANEHAADHHSGDSNQQRYAAAFCVFLLACIEQHDHEDEQHHNGARVDDHLHGRDEFRTQQQIFRRQRTHHDHQRKCAVDGMRLCNQVDRTRYADRTENQK